MSTINLSTELPMYLGKNIKDICTNSYINDAESHCAHFVSHVLGYTFGFRCKGMTGKGSGTGATIRVENIFKNCMAVSEWADRAQGNCLAFVIDSRHVHLLTKTMVKAGQKHVGIFCNEKIYNYSNSTEKVVATKADIFKKFYKGDSIKVYYGTFPSIL